MTFRTCAAVIEVNADPAMREREDCAPLALPSAPAAEDSQQSRTGRVRFLDTIVAGANRLRLLGVRYRPYWIMSDAAALSAVAYAWAFSKRFPSVSGVGLGLAVLIALVAYKVVLEVKAALGKAAARSFLQDCLVVIIPSFLVVSLLFKQPLNLAFLGTLMPLYGCLARIGCFLGGCCYGKPSAKGILYPASSLNRPITAAEGTPPVPTLVHACFRYNSSRPLRRQLSLGRWLHWFGEFRARPGPFFGYISPCIRSFGLCWTFIAPPAHGRDTGAFPKHNWPASWCRWLGSPFWQNYEPRAQAVSQ